MKRMHWFLVAVFLLVGIVDLAEPAFARRVVVHRGPHRRTTVVIHRGHPIRRRLPVVVVHAPRRAVVVAPGLFLAPVVWTAVVVATMPAHDVIVWEDSETITKDEDWTDFTLNADERGRKLYVEIAGKAQLNFAEVVFENGDTQVVDFNEKTHGTGIYELLDFKDGRKVDHVRMIARAKSDEAKITLRMEKIVG